MNIHTAYTGYVQSKTTAHSPSKNKQSGKRHSLALLSGEGFFEMQGKKKGRIREVVFLKRRRMAVFFRHIKEKGDTGDNSMPTRYAEFRLGDIIPPVKVKKYPKKPDTCGNIPFVSCQTTNNGIAALCGETPEAENCITVSTNGNCFDCFYHDYGIVPSSDVEVLYKKGITDDREISLYLCGVLRPFSALYSYNNKPKGGKVFDARISLPVVESEDEEHVYTTDDIDWNYMRSRVRELEQERVRELETYLKSAGLNDYELTEEDKKILSFKRVSDENEVSLGEFELGGDTGLFNIYSPSKRFNANIIRFGGKYPYVARGSSNNGIRGYITEDERYLSPAKSLSFGQDTATVFYQPNAYFTGDKIKVMVLNNHELTPELAEYFVAVISKAFSTFAWGQSSFNENIIKQMKILLPITSTGKPDFDYMERYITALEKQTIADVVRYKDKIIEETKKAVA